MSTLQDHLRSAYKDKTVLVTGHTGFKGAWLCEWLLMLGARVVGISLSPNTNPSLFTQLGLQDRLDHNIQDIRDRNSLLQSVLTIEPDYVFHLAAQPLVRLSYSEPVETYDTNFMGTVYLLDALRELNKHYLDINQTCAAVFVTTDKCYENREWNHAYRENDPLGGYDPYSSSKAAAELAIAAYRRSYFNPESGSTGIGIASARAGNVIGGGDWAHDRILPDCIRHLSINEPIPLRNPESTRPWQHVLEPLGGYLQLAALQRNALNSGDLMALHSTCAAYNFGPNISANQSVQKLVTEVLKYWTGTSVDQSDPGAFHESGRLNLAWEKAHHEFMWHPRWDFTQTVERTVTWYQQQMKYQKDPVSLVHDDINAYVM